jgi:transposase-like protein
MDWPEVPIERSEPRSFRPTYCPWPDCAAHREPDATRVTFSGHGQYVRRCDGRRVPRFRCRGCRRTFSLQTFAVSYYLKRPELTLPIARGLVAGSAHRQIARSAGCHHATVTRRAQRLGRHASLLHEILLRALPASVAEPVIVDDFDAFACSQYFPCTLPTAVGAHTWFVYGFAFAPERRRGRMSPIQFKRRERLERRYGRPPRGALQQAFSSLIVRLPRLPQRIIADDDPAIRRAVSRLGGVLLEVHPNPRRGPKGSRRTPRARARDRALFPNDQLHRFLRHSAAAHRRETIAFGRSYNGLLERLALFVVWRNLVQARSERHPRDGTTAMRLGATTARWDWDTVFSHRLQPSRVDPPVDVWRLYRRLVVTPPLPNERRHTLSRAF